MELEDAHDKEWILQQYLNTVPYGTVNGRTALGIEAAAETFFGKKAKDLTLPESALIAGLPQAPSQYNPFLNPSAAVARRNDVLNAMAANGMITDEAASEAQAASLEVKSTDKFTTKREGYFFDYVQQVLIDQYGVETLRQGGLRVYTTIDPALQDAGRTAINTYLSPPLDPSGAVVAIDPTNGAIRAMASSGTYGERDFNLAAQGHRQPGSTFKVMVLTAAVLEGIDPEDHVLRVQVPDLPRHRRDQAVGGQDLQRVLGGQHLARAGHAALGQLRLRAADRGRRAREGQGRRPSCSGSPPTSTATTARASAASRSASRRSRWPRPTPRSPAAGSSTSPMPSTGSSSPTARARSSATTKASAS